MPIEHRNGVDIHYVQAWEGDDVLLLCGLGDDVTAWNGQLDPFSERYRVTVVDNRGCGLVARRLDTEHAHVVHDQPCSRSTTVVPRMPRSMPSSKRRYGGSLTSYDHMTSASSPVSA